MIAICAPIPQDFKISTRSITEGYVDLIAIRAPIPQDFKISTRSKKTGVRDLIAIAQTKRQDHTKRYICKNTD